MSNNLNVGDLAIVIPDKGKNNVRQRPNIRSSRTGQIPEHAVLAILPRPAGWAGDYPYGDGTHVWWYVRGRTEKKLVADRFDVIEGWTAASKNADPFLMRFEDAIACRDKMGAALNTHLQTRQQAYVLPPDGLIIRKEADPDATRVGGLEQGTVVTVMGGPKCDTKDTKMVWWQAQRIGAAGPADWVSEGNSVEWFLAPLTLEY
jgi:hypothetical protein